YTPGQAELLDPQQRLLLECACEALEIAALGAADGARVGVFVGTTLSKYLLAMISSPRLRARIDPLTMVGAERDCAATRIAYKLNLTGPAVTVQSACSTSLVAVHLAVSALRNGDCDVALAGGASISVPRRSGYRHEAGGAFSADGSSRPFDHRATGTVPGDGAGVVVLRRLRDAVADGDRILAVVRGTAVNNDGAAKVGYTAPSVDGQVAVIRAAHRAAGIEPASISYVEAHGTATPVGDPIEVAALTEAFGPVPGGRCLLGSVKSNLGHLDAAAGITGFIKTVLQLYHRELVPSLHFESANPLLELDRTPFRVSTELSAWPATDTPRRAAVSAFGVGGTNAHVVLEEYRSAADPRDDEPDEPLRDGIVVLSAATTEACRTMRGQWADALAGPEADGVSVADVGFSAATGRPARRYRWFATARSRKELLDQLRAEERAPVRADTTAPRTALVFPGIGGQYRGMASTLARTEPAFADALAPALAAAHACGVDLEPVLAPTAGDNRLTEPSLAVPALFAVEYSLARLIVSWGVRPEVLFGHSTGEYVAAAVAGVLSVEDAVRLLILRAELATEGADGAMMQVNLPESDCLPLLTDEVALAAVNAPDICVLSGARAAVEALAERLTGDGVQHRLVPVRGAGHSALLDPVLPRFRAACEQVSWQPPQLPVVSSVTGTWLTDEQAVDPDHWVRQFRSTVRFVDGLHTLLAEPSTVWVAGPGRAYLGWSRRVAAGGSGHLLLSCLPEADQADDDRREMLTALGRHWSRGGDVHWRAVCGEPGDRRRVALPAYPFQRTRYWVLDGRDAAAATAVGGSPAAFPDGAEPESAGYERPALSSEYRAPRGERESMLAELWSSFFGIARIGVHDDFFELGGDSLLAVRLTTAIRGRVDRALLPGTLLRARTIARLAEALD
ncbi:MAG: beta-ketoacyl synthase N-terminal-like domain-containing protein, partial [Actinocatenispora sp.]